MSVSLSSPQVPPGFRFHPTDEELVDYYLKNKLDSTTTDLEVIREIDLYKIEPWELQDMCRIGSAEQNEWYFFSHKDKKYPTGTRTNRATAAGFWKATGRDKAIYAKMKLIGMRKTLVYYKGRAPNGQKSDWIMHEYRLESYENGCIQTREEGWVVCRVFRKRCLNTSKESDQYSNEHSLEYQMPEFESSIGGYRDLAYLHPPFCKQEIEFENYPPYHPYRQLPQLLESSRMITPLPSTDLLDFVLDTINRPKIHRPCCGNMLNQINMPNSGTSISKSDQNVTDWRVFDKLVASQLSQDETAFKGSGPSPTEIDPTNPLVGIKMLLACDNNQHNTQSGGTENDVDLWSFAQRGMYNSSRSSDVD